MESIYLVIIVVLFLLAISDLMVGVGNDAVNFLNSALGSKAAPFWIIMIIASIGIIIGTTFSSGMMEVARKGIFHPSQFVFSEIIIIFLAVMLTDVILLDLFNTFGFPTSTTVSLVFELLGAAVAISIIKLGKAEGAVTINDYINSAKALEIIGSILSSVVVAFTAGAIIMYLIRFVFSFKIEKTYKYLGSAWGGIAITALTYFMILKGLKGSAFSDMYFVKYIHEHTLRILFFSFIGWTVILELVKSVFKFNILKFIVLVGTFGLAMAFAGNDLVNFIGVPLAAFASYTSYADSGVAADLFSMSSLAEKVETPFLFLLIAGMIMIITLWFSKKARSVTETEINLARQDVGVERFGSTLLSRSLVRVFVKLGKLNNKVLPASISNFINSRFQPIMYKTKEERNNAPAFDLLRASVNLVVASIIIAIATSNKLPLSTTYVTFMVAMGTSLSDGAWGRESAVYRVTGVISVISGWFITAFVAFTVAFAVANIIYFGGLIAIIALISCAVFLVVRTTIHHRKKAKEKEKEKTEQEAKDKEELSIYEKCSNTVIATLEKIPDLYEDSIKYLSNENRKKLKKVFKKSQKLQLETKTAKANIHQIVKELQEDFITTGHYYVQVVDYMRELSNSYHYTIQPIFEYIDNNHEALPDAQIHDLQDVSKDIKNLFIEIKESIINNNFVNLDQVLSLQKAALENIEEKRKKQLKRIKENELDTQSSLLFLNILAETKSMVLFSIRLLKAQRDFLNKNQIEDIIELV